MAYVAFVPARSGSKRVPGKNVKLLAGRPLVVRTLEAFLNVENVKQVIFSTDSKDYWALVQDYLESDKLKLDFRKPEHAGDQVKIFDYLKSNYQRIFADSNDVFLMGLPTAPLRNEQHINQALKLFEKNQKAVFSATEYGFPISFAFYQNEQKGWLPAFDHSPMLTGNTRSQDQQKAYHPNGAIYIRKIIDFSDPGLSTLYQGAVPYFMTRADSVDIDNETDFLIAEAILSKLNAKMGS